MRDRFELRAVDPAWSSSVEDALVLQERIMTAQAEMTERAIRTALVHVATGRIHCTTDSEQNIVVTVDGRPVWTCRANLLAEEVTVEGQWLVWPLVTTQTITASRPADFHF